ncbi:MAG: hypothetical protein IK141_06495 [Clostridia bacterium]|nr:hypothetical protein [Clostridia bacterium]
MKKRVFALLLCGLLLLSLAACGGGGTTNPSPAQTGNATQAHGGASDTGEKPGTEVKGLALTDYSDMAYGYSMLCPDLWMSELQYTDCWTLKDKDENNSAIFAFSEYHPEPVFYDDKTAEVKNPQELLDCFLPMIRDILRGKTSASPGETITDIKWNEVSVSGLPAAEFRGAIDGGKLGSLGITGICVVGEKRPYVFWATDLSKDQSYLDMAQEVLEACVANFKEGS